MPFTRAGRDLALTKLNPATGRFDFDWDDTNNPKFDDTEAHRVASLLLQRRQTPGEAGYIFDASGRRGSRLHTLKDARRRTPSNAVTYALEALQTAVIDGAIVAPDCKARIKDGRLYLEPVQWKRPDGSQRSITLTFKP